MTENDFYVAIQGVMTRYCELHPELNGEFIYELMQQITEEFITENGMEELDIDDDLE